MRPVDKGNQPYIFIKNYQEALPYLKQRLGSYCSYCEMKVSTNLAVEHKESKKSGGDKTAWENLLLACTYCNSRKGEKVKVGEKIRWIWSDENNTFLPFTYKRGVPEINEDYLKNMSIAYRQKVENIFNELELDHCPVVGQYIKDTRYENRFGTYGKAKRAREKWEKVKGSSVERDEIQTICDIATE